MALGWLGRFSEAFTQVMGRAGTCPRLILRRWPHTPSPHMAKAATLTRHREPWHAVRSLSRIASTLAWLWTQTALIRQRPAPRS
ncbi:hypothetical protein GQ53DRAFT_743814 [Thozetella sp. PMI_491]|nr:hypothetical protein GQ53DRAFT_743814 [Thozetella sp. PMI_491]